MNPPVETMGKTARMAPCVRLQVDLAYRMAMSSELYSEVTRSWFFGALQTGRLINPILQIIPTEELDK